MTYTCAACGETFGYVDGWTDEDAAEEYAATFPIPAAAEVPTDTVCDVCYQAMMHA